VGGGELWRWAEDRLVGALAASLRPSAEWNFPARRRGFGEASGVVILASEIRLPSILAELMSLLTWVWA
jgi:hypothetical protein